MVAVRTRASSAQYAFSIVAVALATLLRFALAPLLGEAVPFILFYPAVVLSAWYGGLRPGLAASLLSGTSAWYFFIAPAFSFKLADASATASLLLFLFGGTLVSILAENLHEARRRSEASEAREREAHERETAERRRNEAALSAGRERLRIAMEASRMGTWTRELDGSNRVQWSPELEHMFGLELGEFPGTEDAFFQFVHADDREMLREAVERAVRQRTDFEVEFRYVRKDGTPRWMIGRGSALYDDAGEPFRIAGIGWDITERKRAEALFRAALEASPSAKIVVDSAGRIILVNAQTERLFGYARAELIGQPVEMLVPERFRSRHPRYRQGFAEAPNARPMGAGRDLYGLRKDGSEVPIEIGLNPVEIDGRMLVLSAIVDLSERKRSERALQESARKQGVLYEFVARLHRAESVAETYDAALAAMLGALRCHRASILRFDDQGVMRFVAWRGLSDRYRHAVEGHSPWTRDEANPRPISIADAEAAALEPGLAALLAREGIRALAFIPLVASGRLIGKFMTYYTTPHVFSDVERELALSIARQLALGLERKEAEATLRASEERLRLALDALKEADRQKDEFLAMLSHELRNPLAALTTAARVLTLAAPGDEAATQARDVIVRQTGLMTRLIEDLLDVSRVTMRKMTLDRSTLDLALVVENVVESWRSAGRLSGARILLSSSPAWIHADRARIEQVFANLLDNALKFTPDGNAIAISVRGADGDAVLEVADQGEGIPPSLIDRIFDPFVQEPPGRPRKGGLGLGLALVRRLVELHGGTVEAASAGKGRGAMFRVRLPAVAAPTSAIAPRALGLPAGSRKILIVDDNDDARRMLESALALDGHVVQAAGSGAGGLALAADSPPDVALIDIGLPDIDGYEVARRLRAAWIGRRIALIALTGFGQAEDQRLAFAAGFDAHLTKPVTPDRLNRTIADLH